MIQKPIRKRQVYSISRWCVVIAGFLVFINRKCIEKALVHKWISFPKPCQNSFQEIRNWLYTGVKADSKSAFNQNLIYLCIGHNQILQSHPLIGHYLKRLLWIKYGTYDSFIFKRSTSIQNKSLWIAIFQYSTTKYNCGYNLVILNIIGYPKSFNPKHMTFFLQTLLENQSSIVFNESAPKMSPSFATPKNPPVIHQLRMSLWQSHQA